MVSNHSPTCSRAHHQRSAKNELAHRLSVLHERLAQLKLRHDRYHSAAHEIEATSREVEDVLAKMEHRTKVIRHHLYPLSKMCSLRSCAFFSTQIDQSISLITSVPYSLMPIEASTLGSQRTDTPSLSAQTHTEEVHATRQEILKLAEGLESTFRITLKDLEGTYRRKVHMRILIT